jgi:hypothetical protein
MRRIKSKSEPGTASPTIVVMGGFVVWATSVVVRSRVSVVILGVMHLLWWRMYGGKHETQRAVLSTEQLVPVAPSPNSQLQSFSRPHSASDVAVADLSSILPLELQFVRGRHLPLRSQCESSQAPRYAVLAPVGSSVRPTTRHTAVPAMTRTGCATANVDLAQTATPTVRSSLNPRLLHLMLNEGAKNFAVVSLEKVRLAQVVQLTIRLAVFRVCLRTFSTKGDALHQGLQRRPCCVQPRRWPRLQSRPSPQSWELLYPVHFCF